MADLLSHPALAETRPEGAWVFRALVENIEHCVYLLDSECRYLAVNRAFSQWLERPEAEILGRTVFELWPRPWAVKEAAEHLRVLRGEPIEQEEEWPTRSKNPATLSLVHMRKVPVRDEEGVVRSVLCLFQPLPSAVRCPPSAGSAADSTQKTILVVDNERSIVHLAQTILQTQGYQVLTAEDGRQAVEIYREKNTALDLILLDQNMPGLSGLETMNELLAINPRTRILLMTGGSPPEPSWGKQMLGWGFMSKPWTTNQLLQAVREVLAAKRNDSGERPAHPGGSPAG